MTTLSANDQVKLNENESSGESINSNYEVVLLNNIADYNENINLKIVSIEINSCQSVSITHPSEIVEQTLSVSEGNTYLSVKNNHSPGEYTFYVNITDDEDLIYSKELYIYSDGDVDCASISCIEECRDIYYTNFEASEEDLIILGRMDVPENFTYTKTYYEVSSEYTERVFENNQISCVSEIEIDNNTECITVSGRIRWESDSNILYNLVNNYVYLYDNDIFLNDQYGMACTNENGLNL